MRIILIYFLALLFLTVSSPVFAQNSVVTTVGGNGTTGNVNGPVSQARFDHPYDVAVDAAGNLYTAEPANAAVRKIGIDGQVSFIATVGNPTSISIDRKGNLYVTDQFSACVRKITPDGKVSILASGFSNPIGIGIDGDGNIYVADQYANKILKVTPNGVVTTIAGSGGGGNTDGPALQATFNGPSGVTVDDSGVVYIADTFNNLIRKLTKDGQVITLAGSGNSGHKDGPADVAEFTTPTELAVDRYHNVYVADENNNLVRKITPDGTVSTIGGTGAPGLLDGPGTSAEFEMPRGLAVDDQGIVYVADYNNAAIRRISLTSALVSGTVFDDRNQNCLQDANEPGLEGRVLKTADGKYFASTDANGHYELWVEPGVQTVELVPAPHWKAVCPGATPGIRQLNITADSLYQNNSFGAIASDSCAALRVELSAAPLPGRCLITGLTDKEAQYLTLSCLNLGALPVQNAYVMLELDPSLQLLPSAQTVDSISPGLYRIPLGTVNGGAEQHLALPYRVTGCGPGTYGESVCARAHIYPDTATCRISQPRDTSNGKWDKSSIVVSGGCVGGDTIYFTILNHGAAMAGPTEYRIYDNNVLVLTKSFQLGAGDSLVIRFEGNGDTYRLEADQRPGHPGHSRPRVSVGACGQGSSTTPPLFTELTAVPLDDADDFVAEVCGSIRGSWDPNEKSVVPAGVTPQHFTRPGQELQYHIDFQNTGNDTAFNVVVRDTLSASLDPASIRPGAASHPYTFKLYGTGYAVWTFSRILLPDSGTSEAGSHGFFEFRIQQRPNLPNGTVIENRAGIWFDYNPVVLTNTTFNTISDTTLTGPALKLTALAPSASAAAFRAWPNPTSGHLTLETGLTGPANAQVFDATGRMVQQAEWQGSRTEMNLSALPAGLYQVRVAQGNAVQALRITRQ